MIKLKPKQKDFLNWVLAYLYSNSHLDEVTSIWNESDNQYNLIDKESEFIEIVLEENKYNEKDSSALQELKLRFESKYIQSEK